MVKKKIRKSKKMSLKKEIQDVESWMHHRKKFFWKLFWVVVLIVGLVIISNLYLKVQGVGV